MTDINNRIKDLVIKYLKEELGQEEQLELQEWVHQTPYNRDIFHQITDPDRLNKELKELFEVKTTIWVKIDIQIKRNALSEKPIVTLRRARSRLWIYAVVAGLLFLTGYFWLTFKPDSSKGQPITLPPISVQDVAPGGNKGTLTLANGTSIILENVADGVLGIQAHTRISKENDILSYTQISQGSAIPALTYNTLKTPRAGQFQVILPDGTKVWLNNASSLRYPTSFSGGVREVELEGEGYFEVAKNASGPFSVKIHDIRVKVLGTCFNIMAYDDEPAIKTTLLSGRVSVYALGRKVVLSAGEQAKLIYKEGFSVSKDIDVAETIAWRKGYFSFKHTDIKTVLRQLARWYDVELVFTTTVPDYSLNGVIQRDLTLSNILRSITQSNVHFKIEGKKLIVSK